MRAVPSLFAISTARLNFSKCGAKSSRIPILPIGEPTAETPIPAFSSFSTASSSASVRSSTPCRPRRGSRAEGCGCGRAPRAVRQNSGRPRPRRRRVKLSAMGVLLLEAAICREQVLRAERELVERVAVVAVGPARSSRNGCPFPHRPRGSRRNRGCRP